MHDPPYGEIAELLKRGEVVPFLGAGVNFGTRERGATWEMTSPFLPSGAELSRFLASKISFPADSESDTVDLAKVASYFVETTKRRRLRERLKEVFDKDFEPCPIHNYLAEASRNTPLLIVTTNYDDLTERAFNKLGLPFDLVIHPTDRKDVEASVLWWKHGAEKPEVVEPNQLIVDLKTTSVIYKMHGTVDRTAQKWDSYVITEEDYVDFLSRMTGQTAVPAQFMRYFRSRYFLFLGYGLRDWNLRVVLKNLRTALPAGEDSEDMEEEDEEVSSWAIQFKPSYLETKLWDARKVQIFDVDINEFVTQLRQQVT
ncbi:MAG: SIR2 family protein [Pyrinomonadaceae bacterium]|nr:SIR2 family protein [Pyrinomonadaceae bacterium]